MKAPIVTIDMYYEWAVKREYVEYKKWTSQTQKSKFMYTLARLRILQLTNIG